MAVPIHAVLADPDHPEEHDIEIRHADSFLRVRAEEPPARPRDQLRLAAVLRRGDRGGVLPLGDREGSNEGP